MSLNKVSIAGIYLSCLLISAASSADDGYRQWLQQQSSGIQAQKNEFQAYKDKRDKAFTAFLKTQWTALDIVKGDVRDTAPKPFTLPVAPSTPPDSVEQQPDIKPVVVTVPVGAELIPSVIAPITISPNGKQAIVDFYGRAVTFYYDGKLKRRLGANINKEAVSDYWSDLSRADYEDLTKQLRAQKQAMQLNDWAYAALINKLALRINADSANEGALLSWFLLAKLNYRARVAYNAAEIFLLVPAQQEIFEVPYFTLSNKRYYAVGFEGKKQQPGQVYTYEGDYPGATNAFDMRVTSVVASNDSSQRRHLTFNFEDKKYTVDAIYDRGRIEFFRTYPQLSLNLYFGSNVSAITATPLQQQLASNMQDMSEQQAVNFLLRFVQTAFKYETDEQQFGEENYLFPEETLSYPYSDCEDRAILFAWLVKSLLNLDVVGLDYPGHVAAAVSFSEVVKGDGINYNGKRYTVTDPTYINANAGMTMPDFKKYTPAVIPY